MTDDTMRDQDRTKVVPDNAEFWDTPGTVVSYVRMAAATVTGGRLDLGDSRKVAL